MKRARSGAPPRAAPHGAAKELAAPHGAPGRGPNRDRSARIRGEEPRGSGDALNPQDVLSPAALQAAKYVGKKREKGSDPYWKVDKSVFSKGKGVRTGATNNIKEFDSLGLSQAFSQNKQCSKCGRMGHKSQTCDKRRALFEKAKLAGELEVGDFDHWMLTAEEGLLEKARVDAPLLQTGCTTQIKLLDC